MRIYLAAPYPTIDAARDLRDDLVTRGHTVTSRWLDQSTTLCHADAQMDLDDLCEAELLVAINDDAWADRGTGGRHTELGFALAMDIPVILVGARTQVFHYLDSIRVVPDVDALFEALQTRGVER